MSILTLNEQEQAPATPAAGLGRYWLQDGQPRLVNDLGVDVNLAKATRYNWLRNSGFWFAQRQAPATLTTYSPGVNVRALSADGWSIQNSVNSVQYRRVDTITATVVSEPRIPTSRYYGEFTKLTSAGKIAVLQCMESADTSELRGRVVRLQFWAKGIGTSPVTWRVGLVESGPPSTTVEAAGATSSLCFNMNTVDGADPPPLVSGSYPIGSIDYITPVATIAPDNATIVGSAASIVVTEGVWQRYGVCFLVPANSLQILPAIFSNAALATGVGIAIAQASLSVGPEIFEWTEQPFDIELSRVQRCYQKTFPIDTLPAQNAGLAGAIRGMVNVAGAALSVVGYRFATPVVFRGTATFFNPSAANAFARNTTAGSDATATALPAGLGGAGTSGNSAEVTGIAAWAVGQALAFHYVMDSEP